MALYNATPHDIVVHNRLGDGTMRVVIKRYPKAEHTMRLRTQEQTELAPLPCEGKEVTVMSPPRYTGLVELLPDTLDRTAYAGVLVSALVADWLCAHPISPHPLPLRVYAPDTGPDAVVRDAAGAPVAVTRLIRYDAWL